MRVRGLESQREQGLTTGASCGVPTLPPVSEGRTPRLSRPWPRRLEWGAANQNDVVSVRPQYAEVKSCRNQAHGGQRGGEGGNACDGRATNTEGQHACEQTDAERDAFGFPSHRAVHMRARAARPTCPRENRPDGERTRVTREPAREGREASRCVNCRTRFCTLMKKNNDLMSTDHKRKTT